MENKLNNPSAFPNPKRNCLPISQDGMTLRDYFANSAMQAIISNSTLMQQFTKVFESLAKDKRKDFEVAISDTAYCYADAMLKQREL